MLASEVQLEAATLAAKVESEGTPVRMEFASLPEKYKKNGFVKQRMCIVAIASLPEKTAGGIFLPSVQKEKAKYATQFGRIEAVGSWFYLGKDKKPLPEAVGVGDIIHFVPYSGRRFKLGGGEFITINDTEIIFGPIDPSDDFEIYM